MITLRSKEAFTYKFVVNNTMRVEVRVDPGEVHGGVTNFKYTISTIDPDNAPFMHDNAVEWNGAAELATTAEALREVSRIMRGKTKKYEGVL